MAQATSLDSNHQKCMVCGMTTEQRHDEDGSFYYRCTFCHRDQRLGPYSLEEYELMVLNQNAHCVDCKKPIERGSIRSYDHEAGKVVLGFEQKQWVWFQCFNKKCGYQNALAKVLVSILLQKMTPQTVWRY